MPRPIILASECTACGICVEACPNGVLDISRDHAVVDNEDACDGCGECVEECPLGAIEDVEED